LAGEVATSVRGVFEVCKTHLGAWKPRERAVRGSDA
jgi:hypothetical protein